MGTPPLSKIDLNLLVVLDVLLREKSVARSAAHLNVTSSAVSHALKRLRVLFDNELLVRDGRRMVPTARGRSLGEMLPSLLAQVEQALVAESPFDPATSGRAFRLTAPDFMSPILPRLLNLVAEEAPGIRVEFAAYSPSTPIHLDQMRFDALIAPSFKQQDNLRGVAIGAWPWTVYGRENHPAFDNWSLESWARYPHLQIGTSPPSGREPLDRKAMEKGVTRRIGAVVTHFSMAAPILTKTDMLLSVPSVAMHDAAGVYGLEERRIPFDLNPLELTLFRRATAGDQPEIRWFHDRLAVTVESIAASK